MLIEGLSSKRKREKWRKKEKKGEQKLALSFFLRARKNRDCSRKCRRHQDSGHDSSAWSAAQTASPPKTGRLNVVFRRSALQTSPYDVQKTTKISTTCTYYREILTVRALRSSRTRLKTAKKCLIKKFLFKNILLWRKNSGGKNDNFWKMYERQTTQNKSSFSKSSFIKVYGELLFFSFLPGLHIKTIFSFSEWPVYFW